MLVTPLLAPARLQYRAVCVMMMIMMCARDWMELYVESCVNRQWIISTLKAHRYTHLYSDDVT